MRIDAVILAFSLSAFPAFAQTPDLDEPMTLFASHCIANYITPGYDVQKDLDGRSGVLRLTDEQSVPFLDAQPGSAWTLKTPKSQYVVAVTKNASCYLYALQGDRDRAWTDFDSLTSAMFKPWNTTEFYPTSIGKDTDTRRNIKSVYYNAPEKAPTPAFMITTDYSDKPNSFAIRLRVLFAERGLLDVMRAKKSTPTPQKGGTL